MATKALQPTLWRTCRVLANYNRLKLLSLVFKTPGQTVTTLADQMNLSLPVTSQYLRAMEARGLLTARRVAGRVEYRPATVDTTGMADLVLALRRAFQKDAGASERVFRAATAFTHPRRIELVQALKDSRNFNELRGLTGISFQALWRHLSKLEDRGFVQRSKGKYIVCQPTDAVGRELARLATASQERG
jgi:DNA-binding MarR family transcriptional regulator